VIGAGGFLGRNLVDELLKKQYKVIAFDVVKAHFDDKRVVSVQGSIENLEVFAKHGQKYTHHLHQEVTRAMEGCDFVFHCASPLPSLHNRSIFQCRSSLIIYANSNFAEICSIELMFKAQKTLSMPVV
jgi:hypothetical protein